MIKYYMLCNYCGNKWEQTFYNYMIYEEVSCSKCKDKNIKKTEHKTMDIFGYEYNKEAKRDENKT